MERNSGFTLIELLVVISIISLLSSIIVAGLQEAKIKANDTSRVEKAHAIQQSLELYFSDHNQYPAVSTGGLSFSYTSTNNSNTWAEFSGQLSPYIRLDTSPDDLIYTYSYLSGLKNTSSQFCIQVDSSGRYITTGTDGYILEVALEQPESPLRNFFPGNPGYPNLYITTGGNIVQCD